MRYVPLNRVRQGMILGKTLYGLGGEMLLSQNSIIKEEYINKIMVLGIQGLYIKDDFSLEVEIDDIIKPELRMKCIQIVKSFFVEDKKHNEKSDRKAKEQFESQIKEMLSGVVDSLIHDKAVQINMIDLKNYDEYTYYHCVNVAILAIATGCGMGLNRNDLELLALAGVLHDIGKKFVSVNILNKKGRLTKEEFDEIKKHSANGYYYIKENFMVSAKSYIGILEHHERFDGKGYPNRKEAEKISLFGRILAVVDVYDALISKRSYHEPILPSEAFEYIMAGSGSQFDPLVVRAFSRKVATYPLGTEVKLSNGDMGIVVENYQEFNLRPKIKLYQDSDTPLYIDLKNDISARNITIVGAEGFLKVCGE